jgi:ATP-dependent helicase/nuclease subunit A
LPAPKKPTAPPAFASDKKVSDSAERGTATHVFLQFCDFQRCKTRGIENELAYLVEARFISKHLAGLVDKRQLEAFFNSDFFSELSRARWIYREQRFNILLPASLFTEKPELAAELRDEELLVQGVVDLFFEDEQGRLILCDYKTDYLTQKELSDPELAAAKLCERYKTQLSYSASALARICGRRPDRVVIYSTPLGGTVDVEVDIF